MDSYFPDGSYAAWGWGATMVDTEMVMFSGNGASSDVQYFYSTGTTDPTPKQDKYSPCYEWTLNSYDNGMINITATRPLECSTVENSYVITLDSELSLITAWNPSDSSMSYHDSNKFEFKQLLASDGTCTIAEGVNHNPSYYTHGFFMWGTWALIGLLQIYTNRYWRKHWRWNKIVHAILGLFSMALVITAGFIALNLGGWTINSNSSMHAKAGFVIFISGLVLMLGGMIANIVRLFINMRWNTKWVLRIGMTHRYFGWSIILVSQFVIGTGFVNFYSYDGLDTLGWSIALSSGILFFLGLIIGETLHQCKLRKQVDLVAPETTMTIQEFEQAIVNRRQLVILDELVLDVSKFID